MQSGIHKIPAGRKGKRCKCCKYTQWNERLNVAKAAGHMCDCESVEAEDRQWLKDNTKSAEVHGAVTETPAHGKRKLPTETPAHDANCTMQIDTVHGDSMLAALRARIAELEQQVAIAPKDFLRSKHIP